jgi:hypothetical protein
MAPYSRALCEHCHEVIVPAQGGGWRHALYEPQKMCSFPQPAPLILDRSIQPLNEEQHRVFDKNLEELKDVHAAVAATFAYPQE